MKELFGEVKEMATLSGEVSGNRNILSGHMGVGITYLPVSNTDVMLQCPSFLEFPNIGSPHTLYVDQGDNKIYRWDEDSLKYFIVGSNFEDISIVDGGNA